VRSDGTNGEPTRRRKKRPPVQAAEAVAAAAAAEALERAAPPTAPTRRAPRTGPSRRRKTPAPAPPLEAPSPPAPAVEEQPAPQPPVAAIEEQPAPQPPVAAIEEEPAPQPPVAATPRALPEEVPRTVLGQAVGLRLDGVGRRFKSGEVEVRALEDISFEIAPGEFVAITGPSGCGKSTLLSLLGGLDRPTSGHVYAAGAAVDQLPDADQADYRLQRVGNVFQTFNLIPSLSAEDNVALPLALAGMAAEERRERARMLLKLLGLEDRAGFKPGRLSGGEQQRVAIARALANRPGLILADEPTGNLDSRQGEQVLDLLRDLHVQGATVVLVTHDREVAARADRIVRLQDGRLATPVRSRRHTARAPEPLDPPTRLSRLDALRMGLVGVARRPMRSALTAGGVGLGVGVMALILALAMGVHAEAAAAATDVRLQQVVVVSDPTQKEPRTLGQPTLDSLKRVPHVQQAWGQVALEGSLTMKGAAATDKPPPPSALASLPPRAQWGQDPAGSLLTGRLPLRDSTAEVVISTQMARRLGLQPYGAVGRQVEFSARQNGLQLPGTSPEKAEKSVVQTLTIVGITPDEPLGGVLPGGWIPYETANKYWEKLANANEWKGPQFHNVTLRADDSLHVAAVRDRVRTMGYGAESLEDRLRSEQQHLLYLQWALIGLALIGVVVAFLSIVNTMYTAVLERTTEIGVLKALGARRSDIRLLFTAEAALIGAISGLLGVVVATFLARGGNAVIYRLAAGRGAPLQLDLFQLQLWIAALIVVLAVLFSALSGMLPAARASRLEPVQALRRE
jgi:ABC-type lipoprotein export system ATPase subunit/ABC-type lipoprotein release transport system permease subunit